MNLYKKAYEIDDTFDVKERIEAIEKKLQADAIIRQVENYDKKSIEACQDTLKQLAIAEDIYYYCSLIDGRFYLNYKETQTFAKKVQNNIEELQNKDKPKEEIIVSPRVEHPVEIVDIEFDPNCIIYCQ